MLKNMEEESKRKDERISHLRDCLTIAVSENKLVMPAAIFHLKYKKLQYFMSCYMVYFLMHIG